MLKPNSEPFWFNLAGENGGNDKRWIRDTRRPAKMVEDSWFLTRVGIPVFTGRDPAQLKNPGLIAFDSTGSWYLCVGHDLARLIGGAYTGTDGAIQALTEILQTLSGLNGLTLQMPELVHVQVISLPGYWIGTNMLTGRSIFTETREVWYSTTASEFAEMVLRGQKTRFQDEVGDGLRNRAKIWIDSMGERMANTYSRCVFEGGLWLPESPTKRGRLRLSAGTNLALPIELPAIYLFGSTITAGLLPRYQSGNVESSTDPGIWSFDNSYGKGSIDWQARELIDEPPYAYSGFNYDESVRARAYNANIKSCTTDSRLAGVLAELQNVLPYDLAHLYSADMETMPEVTVSQNDVLQAAKLQAIYARRDEPGGGVGTGIDVGAYLERLKREVSVPLVNFEKLTGRGGHPRNPVALAYFLTEGFTDFASWSEPEFRLMLGHGLGIDGDSQLESDIKPILAHVNGRERLNIADEIDRAIAAAKAIKAAQPTPGG